MLEISHVTVIGIRHHFGSINARPRQPQHRARFEAGRRQLPGITQIVAVSAQDQVVFLEILSQQLPRTLPLALESQKQNQHPLPLTLYLLLNHLQQISKL